MKTIVGLSCPNCQGRLEIPEGSRIVVCPYCEQRSLVRGARGVRRYQVPCRLDAEAAEQAVHRFITGMDRAPGLSRGAVFSDRFVAYLPFWSVWAMVAGWVFGEVKSEDGYEAHEVKILKAMDWNDAACDVAEFGVQNVSLESCPLEAFDAEALHLDGMVFEPVGSEMETVEKAHGFFETSVERLAKLSRVGSVFVRRLRERVGLVYYPLWVVRYAFRGRSFQVVVDGHSGEVLYGKAPGNVWYRAAALVFGMALGALLLVDGPAVAIAILKASDDSDSLLFVLLPIVVGIGLMVKAFRSFRYGEVIEHRAPVKLPPRERLDGVRELFSVMKTLAKLQRGR